MKTGGGVLVCLALAVATPGLADGTGGVLTMDIEMRVQSINPWEWFPAVVNPDYGELYSLGLVNTSGTFTGDAAAPDAFLFLDLPVYAIVGWQEDLIAPLPDPFVPWSYDDPLFGDGTDLATRNFSLAPVGRLDVELTQWSLDLGAGLAEYFDFGVYVDDLAGESIDIQIDAAFTVPPSGPPDYLWYGVSDFQAIDPWDDRVSLSLVSWPVDNGWPGATLDKNFFPLSAPPPGPVPPCPPPPYAPGGGTISNPRFEIDYGEGHLECWYFANDQESTNSLVEAVNLAPEGDPPDYAAHLRAQGEFVDDGETVRYATGGCHLEQGFYIPLDATTVSFMYLAKTVDAIDGTTEAGVYFGDGWISSETALPDTAGAWLRHDISVDPQLVGGTSWLKFTVLDEASDPWNLPPGTPLDSVDLWVDYCHVDGTPPSESRVGLWAAPAGGAWGDAVNWLPQEVPDNVWNAAGTAYDVLYEAVGFPSPAPGEDASGWGPVVLGGNRAVAVQNLCYDRPTDFVIESGSSLRVYDTNCYASAGRWVVEPGAAIEALQLLFYGDASFAVTGDGSGTPSITVRHSFSMGADGTVHDAAIEAGQLALSQGATLTVTGQSRLASLRSSFPVNGALDMTGGLIEAHDGLQVAYGGQLTATGTRIEATEGYGSLTALGNGTATLTGGEVHAQTVAVQGGGTMGLYDVDVYAAVFQVYDGVGAGPATFYADADTVFYLNGQFLAALQDRTTADLTDTTVVFHGEGHRHWMWAGGLDGAGFDDNLCVGTLRLEDGGTLDLLRVWYWPEGGYAQYVENLVLSDHSTLNLGYPLYYKNLVLGADVTVNGPGSLLFVPEPATLALLALGALGALLRRRRA